MGSGIRIGAGNGPLDRAVAAGLPVPPAALLPAGGVAPTAADLTALLGARPPQVVLTPVDAPDAAETVAASAAPARLQLLLPAGAVSVVAAVAAVHAGSVWRRVGAADVVAVREVTAEAAERGQDREERVWSMPPLRSGQRPHRASDGVPLPPWGMRLARLLRRIQSVPGMTDPTVRIDWRDDGGAIWLFGLIPLTQTDASRSVVARHPDKIT